MAPARSKLSRIVRKGVQLVCLGVTLGAPLVGLAQSPGAAGNRSAGTARRLPTQGFQPRHLQNHWDPNAATPGTRALTTPLGSAAGPQALRPAGRVASAGTFVDERTQTIAQTRALQTSTESPSGTQSIVGPSGITRPTTTHPVVTQTVESIPAPTSPFDSPTEWEGTPVHGQPVVTMGEECGADCQTCDGMGGSGIQLLPGVAIDHFSIFGGVHGAKNSSNRGLDGSFGFHEGFNLGTSAKNIVLPAHCGLQFGMMAAQSNLGGAGFTVQERSQIFMTTGAFRRADYGLQGGLVFDYLWDDWYYDLAVGQIRGEISMALSPMNSYGFWFTTSVDDETAESRIFGNDVTETWETMDIYSIFYRTSLVAGGSGEAKLFAGMTGGSDGIIGAQSRLPLWNGFALETEFTYLIPDEANGRGANEVESWNVAINLAWYPGSLACGNCGYHRPMFDVANNGSMILRRRD